MVRSLHLRLFVFVGLGCPAISCVSPKAVGKYASAAGKVTSEFPPITKDMHTSCTRVQALIAQQQRRGWYDEPSLRSRCAQRDTALAGVLAVNNVLSAYFAALARLADDKVASADTEIGALSSVLIKKAGMSDARVTAAAALAKYLSSTLMDGYRRQKLTDVIGSQHANVLAVVDGLSEIISEDYRDIVRDEEQRTNSFFRTVLSDGIEKEPISAVLLLDVRDQRIARFKSRRDALDVYLKGLKTIKTGHQKLYAGRNKLDSKELIGELAVHAETLDKLAAQLEKAY